MSAALALVSDLTLPLPEELFKWEVSVMPPPVQPQSATPSPPPVAPAPPEPQAATTPTPTKPQPLRHEPVVQAMPPAQASQPVQVAQPMESVQPVQELEQTQELQPVKEAHPVQEVQRVPEDEAVQESQSVQTVQAVQHATQAHATAVTRQMQEETRPSREVTQSVSRSDAPIDQAEWVERSLSTISGPTIQDHHVTSVPAATERSLV